MCVVAMTFYYVQNGGYLAGGDIAFTKLVWLSYAILYWFVLPLLIMLNNAVPDMWRRIYQVFFLIMLARAVCELIMMYVFSNWSPYYGIAHDAFSIFALTGLIVLNYGRISKGIYLYTACVIIAMLIVEIFFVQYMVSNVNSENIVYFVPFNEIHNRVLTSTSTINILLTVYLYVFTRKWIDGCAK